VSFGSKLAVYLQDEVPGAWVVYDHDVAPLHHEVTISTRTLRLNTKQRADIEKIRLSNVPVGCLVELVFVP
jgi:hypothetical protein